MSTLKTGRWIGTWANISWTESFSDVGTPYFSIRMWPTVTDLEVWDAGGGFGCQWLCYSTNNTKSGLAGLWKLLSFTGNPSHIGWVTNSTEVFMSDPSNANVFRGNVASLGNNAIYCRELDSLGGGYEYQSVSFTGSMAAEAKIGDVVVTSTTQTTQMSTSIEADMFMIHIPHADSTAVRSEANASAYGFSFGLWDARSGYGRFLNVALAENALTGGVDPVYTNIGSEIIALGGSIDINVKYAISSVGANGFFLSATEVNTVKLNNGAVRPAYFAAKFSDPLIQSRIVDFTLPQSSGTQTISLGFAPKLAIAWGTNVKTQNYFFPVSGAERRNESFFQGYWTEPDGYGAGISWIEAQTATGQDTAYVQTASTFGALYAGSDRALIAEIGSVQVTGSTNLQYYADIFSTTAENAQGFMFIIGAGSLQGDAGGITSSTLKSGQWSGLWQAGSGSWTESYSDAGVPFFSLRTNPVDSAIDDWEIGLNYEVSYSVHSSNNADPDSVSGLWTIDLGNTVPSDIVLSAQSHDHILVDPTLFNIYGGDISSVGNNEINWIHVGGAFGPQNGYQAFTLSGSIQAEAHLGSTLVLSTGQSQLYSLGFSPDLIFVFMPQPENDAAVNSESVGDGRGFSHGFYDVRSSYGRFFGLTIVDSLINDRDPTNTIVSSALSWPGGSVDLNAKFTIGSVSANGFYINATEVTTVYGSVTEVRPAYAAIKFLDPTIDFKILDVTLPDSPGTQTFSLGFAPKTAYALGSSVKTLDFYLSPTTSTRPEGFFQGMWSEGDGQSCAVYYIEDNNTTQDLDYLQVSTAFGQLYGSNTRLKWAEITSVTNAGSTNLQWTVNYSGTEYVNAFFPMLVIGVNENSVAPGSGGGGSADLTGGAVFRSSPVTDNRKFPTPLTNVRGFPTD